MSDPLYEYNIRAPFAADFSRSSPNAPMPYDQDEYHG